MENIETHRSFFANLITAKAGISPGSELASVFASTPRERFVGQPPWKVFTPAGYIETPSADPAFLYQDIVVSLGGAAPLNNGEPSLHALCLATLAPKKGGRVVHVGAGTGYYTTLLAKLVGETGSVDAYEVDPGLARRATGNLADIHHARVHHRSGAEGTLPECDHLYVNAGATAPLAVWLDALALNGRLLFPLTPDDGLGGMLLVIKQEDGIYSARFICQAQFVPCVGARDEAEGQRLTKAFRDDNWHKVKSLHRNPLTNDGCWCFGPGWCLSTE